MKNIFFLLILSILIVGCTNDNRNETLTPTGDQIPELTKLSTTHPVKQNKANEAKDLLNKYDEAAKIYAVNDDKQILIAIEIDHHERFDLEDIEKEFNKIATEHFKDLDVTLTTDKKLQIELQQLEESLHTKKLSKKDLSKKMNTLKKLLKEET